LSKDGGILRLTGETTITDVNYITVLNWLSYQKDLAEEEEKRRKKIMQEYKRR